MVEEMQCVAKKVADGWHLSILVAGIALGMLALVLLSGCSSYVCDRCGKTFSGAAYYNCLEGTDSTLCPSCAEQVYAPFSYEQYKKS